MNTLQHLQILLPQSKFEAISDTVSVAAIASPGWLPYLRAASEEVSLVLPLAGLFLILVNIVARILITRKILRKDDK